MRWPHVRQISEQIVVVAAMRPLNQQRPRGTIGRWYWRYLGIVSGGWRLSCSYRIQMNVIECLLWAAVAGFELTILSGAVLLLTRQAI